MKFLRAKAGPCLFAFSALLVPGCWKQLDAKTLYPETGGEQRAKDRIVGQMALPGHCLLGPGE